MTLYLLFIVAAIFSFIMGFLIGYSQGRQIGIIIEKHRAKKRCQP